MDAADRVRTGYWEERSMTFWAMLGFAAVLIGALFLANNLQPRKGAVNSAGDRGGVERGFGTGLLVLIVGYSVLVVRAAKRRRSVYSKPSPA
jgi:hypothetical protein